MATTIYPSAGVVTINDALVSHELIRVVANANITSWNMPAGGESNALPDGHGVLLEVTVQSGFTCSFSGLADVWTGTVPTVAALETIYFPIVQSNGNWIADSPGGTGGGDTVYTTYQSITQSGGTLTVDASLGYLVDVNLNQNVTALVVNNLDERKELSIWLNQVGGGFSIAVGSAWNIKGDTFTFNQSSGALHEIIVWQRSGAYYYQNGGSVLPSTAQVRITAARLTATEA